MHEKYAFANRVMTLGNITTGVEKKSMGTGEVIKQVSVTAYKTLIVKGNTDLSTSFTPSLEMMNREELSHSGGDFKNNIFN